MTISKYLEDVQSGRGPRHMQLHDENVEKEIRVAVVSPKGMVNTVKTGPSHLGGSGGVVFWSQELNRPVIPSRYQDTQPDGLPGHVFYLEGCQRTDTMDFYEKWKAIDDDQQAAKRNGLALPKYTGIENDELYPPWVMARRKQWRTGRREVDARELIRAKVTAIDDGSSTPRISLNFDDNGQPIDNGK